MERVIVTNPFVSVIAMQVCASGDVSDEEILGTCNRENPCGTTHGWAAVIRDGEPKDGGPIQCLEYPERTHFIVTC